MPERPNARTNERTNLLQAFLVKLRATAGCSFVGVEGGHWFFLSPRGHAKTVELMEAFIFHGARFRWSALPKEYM